MLLGQLQSQGLGGSFDRDSSATVGPTSVHQTLRQEVGKFLQTLLGDLEWNPTASKGHLGNGLGQRAVHSGMSGSGRGRDSFLRDVSKTKPHLQATHTEQSMSSWQPEKSSCPHYFQGLEAKTLFHPRTFCFIYLLFCFVFWFLRQDLTV